MWCWHKWTKWKPIECGDVLGFIRNADGTLPVVGKYEMQRRECELCGKSQIRETSG